MIKKILVALLVVFVVIQFIRPTKNESTADEPQAITKLYTVPDDVNMILIKACYDCHSNHTRYPWYFNIQPAAWWMADHIKDAKEELNFSEFGSLDLLKQAKKLRSAVKEVNDHGMPLNSYLWIHKDAILTEQESMALTTWATELYQKIVADNHLVLPPPKTKK
jgi:hypothetical protein